MKVLFLDVDGVLNSTKWMMSDDRVTLHGGVWGMNINAVNILKYIVDKTKCKIVVSSSWRIGGIEEGSSFYEELKRTDPSDTILNAVIGKTPQGGYRIDEIGNGKSYVRGNEIQLWIDDNEFDGKFAILDDDSDMAHLSPKLVQTNLDVGLTRADANKVINLLKD